MKRQTLVPVAAVALYVAFWLAALFGYIRVDRSHDLYDLLRALAVVVPAGLLGFAVGRWWVAVAGLVFPLAAALPERTAIDGIGVDVTLTGIYGVSLRTALELLALTTPWVLFGVLGRKYTAARGPAADAGADARQAEHSG